MNRKIMYHAGADLFPQDFFFTINLKLTDLLLAEGTVYLSPFLHVGSTESD